MTFQAQTLSVRFAAVPRFNQTMRNANICRRHSRNAGRLAERGGANLHQLLARLDAQARDSAKIKAAGICLSSRLFSLATSFS